MKKIFHWMLGAFLIISGAMELSSCSNDDNPSLGSDEDLATKLQGKWMTTELEGSPILTADKKVVTFLSADKATVSFSSYYFYEDETLQNWSNHGERDVVISGNKVALVGQPDEHVTLVDEMIIESITDDRMQCLHKCSVLIDGVEMSHVEVDVTMEKQTTDYSDALVGIWEGNFGTAAAPELWRWEFRSDGTYVFYRKKGETWVASEDEFSGYIVDGKLLCVRWKNTGTGDEEQRQWWIIDSINDDKIQWSSYDGDTDTNVELTKVKGQMLE